MRRSIGVVSLFAVGLLAGCGSSSSSGNTSSGNTSSGNTSSGSAANGSTGRRALTVSESEFKITPKTDSVAATGSVAITVHNTGKVIHSLAVQTPSGIVKTSPIQPGATASLTVSLTKTGSYRLYCPIDHHAQLGMVARLTVGGAPTAGGGAASTATTPSGGSGY
jgi:uncharacterized cupredoxin-like copper-binding protein